MSYKKDIIKPDTVKYKDIHMDIDNKNIYPMLKKDKSPHSSKPKRIYNLSVTEIGKKIAETILHILNELTEFHYIKKPNFSTFINIFIKNDRLIYLGILSIIIAFMLFFISATSDENIIANSQNFRIKIE